MKAALEVAFSLCETNKKRALAGARFFADTQVAWA
jgi:hypothetical protein